MSDSKDKTTCPECRGLTGFMQSDGAGDVAWDTCRVCNGEGYIIK